MSYRGRVFMGQYDPTKSVKALKEDRVIWLRDSIPLGPPPPWYNNTTHMQYDKINKKQT